MYILALTGSIATGKSTVLKIFSEQNIATISADEIVHKLYDNQAFKQLALAFPIAINDNKIDRKILKKIILGSTKNLKILEDILHPLVQKEIEKFILKSKEENRQIIVLEIPLLFESNNKYQYDAIAVTYCDEETQLERVLLREGMSKQKLQFILNQQMPQKDKKERADFLIDSSTGLEDTKKQVKDIILAIKQIIKTPKKNIH